MEKKKLDRILSIIREQMATGSTPTAAGFSGAANSKGPTAGFDPVMGLVRRKKYASLGVGSRKRWMKKKPTP